MAIFVRTDEIVKKKARQRAQEATKNAKDGRGGVTHQQKPTLPNISLIEEGRNSPMAGAPRIMALPHIPASPGIRKTQPVQDPYRRQHPPRPYSPGPRCYTPSLDDDGDTKPLRQEDHQQHYHNRNMRLDQQYDFSDDRSEISDGTYSSYATVVSKSHAHGHQREGSDTNIFNHGRPSKAHHRQGHVVPRDANMYGEVMMSDLSRKGVHGARGYHEKQVHVVTGLGGGLGQGSSGSVVGSGVGYGPSKGRGHHLHHHHHHNHNPQGQGYVRS